MAIENATTCRSVGFIAAALSAALSVAVAGCGTGPAGNDSGGVDVTAGNDSAGVDVSAGDTASNDVARVDAGGTDVTRADASAMETGSSETGASDVGSVDGAPSDALLDGASDATASDVGPNDVGTGDVLDAAAVDAPTDAANACIATTFTLNPGGPGFAASGTTAGSTALFATSCLTDPTPSVVYALNLTGGGTLTATVTAAAGSSLLPVLDIRPACSALTGICTSYGTSSTNFAGDVSWLGPPGAYYFVVTGSGASTGAFTVTARLTPAACGDGVANPGESCDPGMAVANDGCGAPGTANQCQLVAAPTTEDVCPGQGQAIPVGTTIFTEAQGYSTWGFEDDYVGSCLTAAGGTIEGVDRVFQLTPAASGTMTVEIGYAADGTTSICGMNKWAADCWAAMLYARSTCATASTELACSAGPATNPFGPQTISFHVTAGTPYWVFVDGWDNTNLSAGPFNLVVRLQ